MIKKGSWLYGVLHLSCPRCQQDKLFEHGLYNFKQLGNMRTHCRTCGLKYSIEPGFFYGAAYVSYGLTVGVGIFAFLLSLLVPGEHSTEYYILVVVAALLISFPLSFALSRAIWLHMFIAYNPQKRGEK